jgi:DNA-binding Xre family transcriptional regulator
VLEWFASSKEEAVAGIISKARRIRLEYQNSIGRIVTLQEVAREIGVTEAALSRLERGLTERIDFDMLTKLCRFYSEKLERTIGVGDILEYDPNKEPEPEEIAA